MKGRVDCYDFYFATRSSSRSRMRMPLLRQDGESHISAVLAEDGPQRFNAASARTRAAEQHVLGLSRSRPCRPAVASGPAGRAPITPAASAILPISSGPRCSETAISTCAVLLWAVIRPDLRTAARAVGDRPLLALSYFESFHQDASDWSAPVKIIKH
jgi:hypothetical protein